MLCKLCHKIETDNTSGICWLCSNKQIIDGFLKIRKDGTVYIVEKDTEELLTPKKGEIE